MDRKFGVLCEGTLIVGNSKTGLLRMRKGVSLKEAKKLAESGLYTLALAKHKTALEQYLAKQKIPRGSIQEAKRQLREGREGAQASQRISKLLGSSMYLSGGLTLRGDHVAAKINETELDSGQLSQLIEAGIISLSPDGKKSFTAKFGYGGIGESKKRRLREASGDPIGSFIRDLERDMRAAAEIMTDVDWSKINNTSALALRVVGMDAETKKALAKMKKSGTYLQAF